MATRGNSSQQTATQQQDGNSVVFVDTHLTKLDDKKIKRIGLYTASDLPQINQLLTDLHRVFPKKDGLLDRQTIYVRLNGETRVTKLTTDLNFPDAVEDETPGARQVSLYLSDLARITIGLAKTFHAIWQDDLLREFTPSFDELNLIAEWTGTSDGTYISEFDLARNAYKIQELLDLLTDVFAKHADVVVDDEAEAETSPAEAPAPQSGTATVPASASLNANETTEDADGGASEDPAQTNNPQENSDIATEALFISSAAYHNLITQFLDNAGLNEASLSPELQRQLSQLSQSLKDKLWDIIENLPPEQRQQLLDHGLRIFLYQKLLIELQKDPLFFTLLDQFYQGYAQFIYEKSGLAVAEEQIAEIERYFATVAVDQGINEQELNPVLEKIRAQIKAWKAQVVEQAEQEQQQSEKEQEKFLDADKDKDGVIEPEELEDYAISRMAPPKIHFQPNQESQLDAHLSSSGHEPQRRRLIQDQSARMLWGTLAELFKDDVDQLNKLPQSIRDQVYTQTLTYIMGLSADEQDTLIHSPSSLLRHIKNNSFRILGDAEFQHNYTQYTETKTATIISRANRVEKETEWAYTQLTFELFGAHNISDENVPDTPDLQGVKDEVGKYLHETVFAYMEQLPTEDLLHLYLHSKDRNEFLKEVHKYLNADQVFVENVSLFYNNLLIHYEKSNQISRRDDLQRSLNTMAQFDGRYFRVRASSPAPKALLDNSLGKVLKTDSKMIFNQSDLTVKALVLNLGLQDTLNLIQKNRISVLESVFQLPPGTLTTENLEDFRSFLSQYAQAQASELVVSTASGKSLSGIEMMYPGLRLDKADTKFTKSSTASSSAADQISSVRTVQTVVQSNGKDGDKVVAEATDTKTIKEKRDVVLKYFGGDWGSLSQADQAALYLYYDLPFNEQQLKTDINNKLPFIYEYIDFRAKKDYGKVLKKLSEEYERHGQKNFNSVFKADYLEATPSADHQRKVNQLVLSVQAYNFSLLEAGQQLAIAQAAGYATAQALIEEQAILAQNALSNAPELNQIIQQLQFIDELLPEDLAAQTDVTDQSFLENIRTSYRPTSAEVNSSPQTKLLGALQQVGGNKLKGELLKKGATSAAIKGLAGAATGGTLTAITIGWDLLKNKRTREFLIYGSTALVSSLLLALSSWGGILGALMGAAFGFQTGGFFGAAGGGLLGTYGGSAIFPQQWGNSIGFSPRQAPGLESLLPENNASISDVGMRDARAANSSNAASPQSGSTAAATSAQGSSTTSASANNAANAANASQASTTASAAATTTPAAAASSFFSSLLGMPIALAAPTVALIGVTFLTGMTILVISGAFLVPIPTRDSDWKGIDDDPEGGAQEIENRYIEVDKTASITQIENGVDTEVTYTIKVTPKNDYTLRITKVTDTFRKSTESGPPLSSGITEGSFPLEPFTEPFEFSYSVMIGEGLVDTRVTNTLNVGYEAIDRSGYTTERNGLFKTSASVKVGDPVEGCWPVTGTITQLPYGHASHGKGEFNSDAYDIGAAAGTSVYSPYTGRACRQNYDGDGYGNWINLTVPMQGVELVFIFGHLQKDAIPKTQQCMDVAAGDLLGTVDTTGNSTGNHLHYELVNDYPTGGLTLVDLIPKEEGIPKLNQPVGDCHE